ncbi:MAG TPA: glycosyltransferase, partial [Terriglobales bacterium]|nr:glycosyltransferase [Terriglobales bacterium]
DGLDLSFQANLWQPHFVQDLGILTALQVIVEGVGLLSGAAILVFSLAQAWLAILYWRTKNGKAPAAEIPAPWAASWPSMLVQLPIYNERYVVERLLRCVAKIDYPPDKLTIQLLDDSSDETAVIAGKVIAEIAKENGIRIEHIRRPDRRGFKAGALDYGLKICDAEFIAIFDADFLPRPDFVKRVLAYFADPKVGMVQTRWEHLNANYSIITRMMAFAIDNHFSVEHGGRQASESFINFNGTGGMWRRKTIDDAGGWKSDTLTEDLDLSFRSQIKGWKFIFAEDITTPSELPIQMSAVRSQQFRWTKGAAETGRKTIVNLWHSKARLLTKVVGSFHMLNSFVFLFLLVFGLSTAALPFLGIGNFYEVAGILNFMISAATFATIFTYWTAQRTGDFIGSDQRPSSILYTTVTFMALATGLCLHCSRAVIQGLFGKTTPFVRTPKLNITAEAAQLKGKQAYTMRGIPPVALVESAFALGFLILAVIGFGHPASVFTGVYLFYAIGFIVVSYLSLREILSGT